MTKEWKDWGEGIKTIDSTDDIPEEKAVETELIIELSPELLIEDVPELLRELDRTSWHIDTLCTDIAEIEGMMIGGKISEDLRKKVIPILEEKKVQLICKKDWYQVLMKGKVTY